MQGEEGFIYIYRVIAYRDICNLLRGYMYSIGLSKFINTSILSRYTVSFLR